MFLSVSVAVTLGRRLVQWTIIDIQHSDRSFLDLFNELKAGRFDCIEVIDEMAQANLQHVFVVPTTLFLAYAKSLEST